MKKKFLLIVVTVLGLLSVFSIGFASWILTKPMDSITKNDVMDIIVYEPYDNAKYIEIKDFTPLQYYNTGFVNNNVEISNTGKVIVNFKFNIQAYKNYLVTQGLNEEQISNQSVVIELLLKHAQNNVGINFFESSLFDFSYVVEENKLDGEGMVGNSSCATITLSSLPDTEYVEFSVIYNITYKGNDFKSEVFANIQGVRFAIEAKVTRE